MKTDVFYPNSMDSMVEYLNNHGFEVDKKYLSAEKKYEFSITRGTKTIIDYFVYPEKDGSNKAMIMKEFCDYLIRNFEVRFRDPITRRNPTCYDPTIDLTSFIPTITKVIFNDPATIVFWSDGTKTVVKTQNGETFDPEKGLAMAIAKRAFGNRGNYYNHLRKWVDKYNKDQELLQKLRGLFDRFDKGIKALGEKLSASTEKTYPIKSNETCAKCRWSIRNDCSKYKHCEGCPQNIEGAISCKCSSVNYGEPCSYFEKDNSKELDKLLD